MRSRLRLLIPLVLVAASGSCRRPTPEAESERLGHYLLVREYANAFLAGGGSRSNLMTVAKRGTVIEREHLALTLIVIARTGNAELTKEILPIFAEILKSEDHTIIEGRVVFPSLRVMMWCYGNTTTPLRDGDNPVKMGRGYTKSVDECRPRWVSGRLWGAGSNPKEWDGLWAELRGQDSDAADYPPRQRTFHGFTFIYERHLCLSFCERKNDELVYFNQKDKFGRVQMYYWKGGIMMPWVRGERLRTKAKGIRKED